MKHRNLLVNLLLTVVTLGIYHFVWLELTRIEMARAGAKQGWPVWSLLAPWLPVIALFFLALTYPLTHASDESRLVSWFLISGFILASIFSVIWAYRYAMAVAQVTNNRVPAAVTTIIWVFITPLFWQLMVQALLNDAVKSTTQSSAPSTAT